MDDTVQTDWATQEKRIERLKATIKQYQKDKEALGDMYRGLVNNHNVLNDRIRQLEAEKKALEIRNRDMDSKVNGFRKAMAALEVQYNQDMAAVRQECEAKLLLALDMDTTLAIRRPS